MRVPTGKALLTLVAVALTAARAPADSISWIGPGGGNWTSSSSWSSNTVPGSLDDVTLGAGGGTVSGTGTFAFSNGTLGGAALTVNNGGFTWDNGTLLTAVNLNAGGGLISGLGTKILGNGAQLNLNVGTTSFVGVI